MFAPALVDWAKRLVWWGSPFWTVFKWFVYVWLGFAAFIGGIVAISVLTG